MNKSANLQSNNATASGKQFSNINNQINVNSNNVNSSNLNNNNLFNLNHNIINNNINNANVTSNNNNNNNNSNSKKLNNYHSNSISNSASANMLNNNLNNNLISTNNLNKSSNVITQYNSNSNNNNATLGVYPINNTSINFNNLNFADTYENIPNSNVNNKNQTNYVQSAAGNNNNTSKDYVNSINNFSSPRNNNTLANQNNQHSLFDKNNNHVNLPLQTSSNVATNNSKPNNANALYVENKRSGKSSQLSNMSEFSPKAKKREKTNSLSFKKEDLISNTNNKFKEKETNLETKLKITGTVATNAINNINQVNTSLKQINRKSLNKKSNENIQFNQSANENNFLSNKNVNVFNSNNLNNLNNHTRSLSFQDENFIYKSKSSFSELDFENVNFLNYNISGDINKEINILLENLKQYNSINIKNFINDQEINKLISDIYLMKSSKPAHKYNKSDINFLHEIKTITENLANGQINSNEMIASLVYFINLLSASDMPKQLIEHFFKNYSVVNWLDLLNNTNIMNNKFLLIFCNAINTICVMNSNYIEEFITYQFIYYLMNLIFVFNDVEIKAELIYFIFQILIRSQNSLKVKIIKSHIININKT